MVGQPFLLKLNKSERVRDDDVMLLFLTINNKRERERERERESMTMMDDKTRCCSMMEKSNLRKCISNPESVA